MQFRLTGTQQFNRGLLLISAIALLLFTLLFVNGHTQAACASFPTDKGTATSTVNVPAVGTYYIWSRNRTSSSTSNAYYLQVDNSSSNCFTVGDATIPNNTWTWVNYQNGNTSSRMSVNLSAGSHSFKLYGVDSSLQVDRLILTSDSACTPSGTGDNCSSSSTDPPPVVISNPNNPTTTPTYDGTITVGSGSNKTIVKVDGQPLASGTGAVTLDTTQLSDGYHTLAIESYDANGNKTITYRKILVENNKTPWAKFYNGLYNGLGKNRLLTIFIISMIVVATVLFIGLGLYLAWYWKVWERIPFINRIHLGFLHVPNFVYNIGSKLPNLKFPLMKTPEHPATASGVVVGGTHAAHAGTMQGNVFQRFFGHPGSRWFVVLGFALVGTMTALYSLAATTAFVIEPENGSLATATRVSDGAAAGGSYLLFGTGSCPAGQTGTPPNCTTPPPATCPVGQTGTPPNCVTPPTPPTTGYPDASNTGVKAGITRTNSGSISTSSDGQVIQNLNINGTITVGHNNVIVRNVKITNPGGPAILQYGKTGLVIEDCEIDGTGNSGAEGAVGWGNYTIRRCNIHHFGEGLAANGGTVIEDNYIHDFTNWISAGAHQDGIQLEYPGGDVVRHNTILMGVDGANGTIHISSQPGSALIENNLLGSTGGKDISAAGGTWRNNKITDRLRLPPSGQPLSRIFEYGTPHTICGTTFYDGPNAGQPVEGDGPC